jgi:hypothetical protein
MDWTKLTNGALIQGLFCSLSSVMDQNDSDLHIEGLKYYLPNN